jgi:signal peptidase I
MKIDKRKGAVTGFGFGLLVVLGFAVFFQREFVTVQVTGQSMEPAFRNGERLLASSAYWLVGPIRKHDVVVAQRKGEREHLIKRVAFLPGETVPWQFIPEDWPFEGGEFRVPPGHYFLLGDNLAASEDSRKFGPVPFAEIQGKVVLVR